jgi:hypothetical protein
MLENLPKSFLLQLVDIDPVVGMVYKNLHIACGVKRVDAWRFITSRRRCNLALYLTIQNMNVNKLIKCVVHTKTDSDDRVFSSIISFDAYIWYDHVLY